MNDVCGVAALTDAHEFLLTSGNDGVRGLIAGKETLAPVGGDLLQHWIWDNHLLLLGV
jgi:hypothetical protein